MRIAPVPDDVSQAVLIWHGDAGRRWLDQVPATVERILDRWSLRPAGGPFEGGSHSYALPVRRPGGEPAVLKVIYLDEENRAEPTGLHAYGGDGAIRLYDFDPGTGAMLLERAEPGTSLLEHRFEDLDEADALRERVAIACGLYRRLWRAPLRPDGFPDYPVATGMLEDWAERFGEPGAIVRRNLPPAWRRRAVDLCEALGAPAELGVGNRDTHLGNIVAAAREPWLLLDPKPYLAERAFDAGFFLFKQVLHGPLGAPELLRSTAAGLGADLERVRAWAMLRTLELAADADTESGLASCMAVLDDLDRA